MGRLHYASIQSLDGYVADADGSFEWAAPDEEVHAFINEVERPIGTYLLGRRMYEVLVAWETMDTAGEPAVMSDYAEIWRSSDKVVYSSSMTSVESARTRIERAFDADAVRILKAGSTADLSVGGPGLAAHAIRAGLVDAYHLFVVPVLVGGGTRSLPDGVRQDLTLVDERRFGNGVAYLHYRSGTDGSVAPAPVAGASAHTDR